MSGGPTGIYYALYLRWAMQDAVFGENSHQSFDWNPTYSLFWYPIAYGLPFFLALFAAHGLLELRRRSGRVRALSRGIGAASFGAILFVKAPLILMKDLSKPAGDREIYASQPEINAARFLDVQPQGSVRCSFRSGNVLAWLSRKKVYQGHWLLAVDSSTKRANLRAFYNRTVPADLKRNFLAQAGIAYVDYGPNERQLGSPDPSLPLESIYDAGGITTYRVR